MDFVNPDIEKYAMAFSSPEPEVLQRLSRDTQAKILKPRMLSGHLQGRFLSFVSRMLKPRRILEIGTYTGYSAICLAEGLTGDGILHTIDHNAELEDFARVYFKMAGVDHQVKQHIGEALDILPLLDDTFDLVFIDADKPNYIRYFEILYPRLREGAIVLADNALWSGKVLDSEESMDDDTAGIARFNRYIREHPGVYHVLLPFRDGVMLIEKTGKHQ
ncbi:MAG: O-methyltransferase [Bacteroidia bacterium]|nr:MAG: O-methyltransferase [Bacteroidia bacterium]